MSANRAGWTARVYCPVHRRPFARHFQSFTVTATCFAVIFVMLAKPLPFIVGAGEYAIVTDFGKPTQVVTSPGLRFRRAYESVRKLDRRLFVCASLLAEFDF